MAVTDDREKSASTRQACNNTCNLCSETSEGTSEITKYGQYSLNGTLKKILASQLTKTNYD